MSKQLDLYELIDRAVTLPHIHKLLNEYKDAYSTDISLSGTKVGLLANLKKNVLGKVIPPLGVIAMFVGMVVLVVFVALAKFKAKQFQIPATVFMWICLALFIIWAVLLTTSVFFNFPKPVNELLGRAAPTP
jgi:hypothetical protein